MTDVRRDPGSPEEPHSCPRCDEFAALMETGFDLMRAGHLSKAKCWFRSAKRVFPDHPATDLAFGETHLREGKLFLAERRIRGAWEAVREELGGDEYLLDDWKNHSAAFGYMMTTLVLARVTLKRGDPPAALQHVESVVEHDPENELGAFTLLGSLQALEGRYRKAVQSFERSRIWPPRWPSHASDYLNWGCALWLGGDPAAALERWRVACLVEPELAAALAAHSTLLLPDSCRIRDACVSGIEYFRDYGELWTRDLHMRPALRRLLDEEAVRQDIRLFALELGQPSMEEKTFEYDSDVRRLNTILASGLKRGLAHRVLTIPSRRWERMAWREDLLCRLESVRLRIYRLMARLNAEGIAASRLPRSLYLRLWHAHRALADWHEGLYRGWSEVRRAPREGLRDLIESEIGRARKLMAQLEVAAARRRE